MIQLSKAAVTEIKRIQSKQSNPNVWFRLGVETGGCAGWYYTMAFDEQCNPDDLICECDGVQVTVDSRFLDYLNGLTLDYSQDLMGGGFRFHNPKAAKTCGCGNSFSIVESPTP
ncbi:iron-sulfur cluster assembly accessory protein [Oscillatoria sp. HE19RPO]|uniref:HesB/IscA family protein n=1 Tax=Oscillatoria sp. HE19RPO TaxID=2954806 RepID=UPI0020C521DD|nr:iron-sulfur cluster assembly accessory protein [Oscillatoria sp. HE19RPO]